MIYLRKHLLILFFLGIALFVSCESPAENPVLNPHEGYVEVEGGKIWYRVLGQGDEAPLLLLHGGPGGTHRYFYELAPLSENRPIILFDQLGSGRSDYHTDTALLKVDKFVEQVQRLKTHLNLNEFTLLGHSWGAALGLEYYLEHPEGVQGIIFSSPYLSTPIWTADADTLISTLADTIQTAIKVAEQDRNFKSEEYLHADSVYWSKFGLRTAYTPHALDTVPAPSNKFIYNYMWGPSEFTATGTLKNYDNHQALTKVQVPVLFVTGEYDEARPVTVKYFQTLTSDAEVSIIDDAGHSTMRDNSQQYNQAIRSFLNELDR